MPTNPPVTPPTVPSIPTTPPCRNPASKWLSDPGFDSREYCDTSWCSPCCVWDVPPPTDPPYEWLCCDGGCGCPEQSANAVRYTNGEAVIKQKDLISSGQGGTWGQTRNYSNQLTAQDQGANGNSWGNDELPYVTHDNLYSDPHQNTQAVVRGADHNIWFNHVSSGSSYTAKFFVKDTLTRASNYFEYTDAVGRKFKFFDHSTTWPVAKRGRLYSYKDPKGHETVVSYDGSDRTSGFVMVAGSNSQGYYYDYYGGGDANAGKLQ